MWGSWCLEQLICQQPHSMAQWIRKTRTEGQLPGFKSQLCLLRVIWASLVAQEVKNHLQWKWPGFSSWTGKILYRRKWQPTPVFLENPMDRGAWWSVVHGISKSWTWLSNWHFHFHTSGKSQVENLGLSVS